MKQVSAAIQALIDADTQFPVIAVEITLNDGLGAVLYLSDQPVTISAQPYEPDVVKPPSLVISDGGIDHVTIELNNADNSYSTYDNDGSLHGASISVSQYFATSETLATLEGPVLAFTGVVSQASVLDSGVLSLVVLVDARIGTGAIGRTITGRCTNVFRDANCGYTHSAVIATSGTYPAEDPVPISGSAATGQFGLGALPMRAPHFYGDAGPTDRVNRVRITRAGVVIYGDTGATIDASDLFILTTDLPLEAANIYFDKEVTVQSGDKVEYVVCPRDSMSACARRWQFGSASRQQDKWMGMDYLRVWDRPDLISAARFEGVLGGIIPILYGHRWIEPVLVLGHQDNTGLLNSASWQTSQHGPMVFALLSEGEIDTGIEDVSDDVELDGILARDHPDAFQEGASDFKIKLGTAAQTVNDFAPRANRNTDRANYSIPALPAFRHVAYVGIDFPSSFELVASELPPRGDYRYGTYTGSLQFAITLNKPALRLRAKGRKVYTWSFVGDVPTKSVSTSYSTNPIWQLLDLLTSPFRTAESDAWSAGVDEDTLDIASFIKWAEYCDENISVFDSFENPVTVDRYSSALYITSQDRSAAINALLTAARASLVFRNGEPGVVCDAPVGGKGTATAGGGTTLTDSRRGNAAYPSVPSWPTGGPNGLLEGLRVKILAGTGAGQVRTIASNTRTQITVTVAWATNPDATSQYAIYAVEINTTNCDGIENAVATAPYDTVNQVVVEFDSSDHRGHSASVPILDTVEDDSGRTHVEKFGLNETSLRLDATIDWQQAVRHGWYVLRKGLDCNRRFVLKNVNVSGLPIERFDLLLLSHDIAGIANEIVQVERIVGPAEGPYEITCSLYREHVYVDWPTDEISGLEIASNLPNPHGVPPHVSNVAHDTLYDSIGGPPLILLSCDLPQWPYAGWHVLWEVRAQDELDVWSAWEAAAVSKTVTASFRASKLADYQFRAVFVSHNNIRADAAKVTGTSSGSNGASTLNDTNKTWSPDMFVGLSLLVTAGTGSGQERVIESNTETQLVLTTTWSVTPDATSVYQIYAPAPTDSVGLFDGVDADPQLDQDDEDWFLKPGRNEFARSVKYLVTTDGSTRTATQVRTTGTLSTAESIDLALGPLPNGTVIKVFQLSYEKDDGTGVEGPLRTDIETYAAAGRVPTISWRRGVPAGPDLKGIEAVRFTVTDDSDEVALWVKNWNEGSAEPAWNAATQRFIDPNGAASSTGYSTDPLSRQFEYTRPLDGDPAILIKARAEDGDGNISEPPIAVRIDAGIVPSGLFVGSVDRDTGIPRVTASTVDPDSGSWRFRLNKVVVGGGSDGTFLEPQFDDLAADEFAGSNFGVPEIISAAAFRMVRGEKINGWGYFFRTTDDTDSVQEVSPRSEAVYFEIVQGVETGNSIRIIDHQLVPVVQGGEAGWNIAFTLMKGDLCQSVHIEVSWVQARGTALQPPPSTTYGYEYDENLSLQETRLIAEDGAGNPLLFLRSPEWPDDGVADGSVAIIATPYDQTGGEAGSGNAGEWHRTLTESVIETGSTGARFEAPDGLVYHGDRIRMSGAFSIEIDTDGRPLIDASWLLEADDVTANGDTNDPPGLTFRGKYDSDTGGGVISSNYDMVVRHRMTAVTPTSRLEILFGGTERLHLTNAGKMELGNNTKRGSAPTATRLDANWLHDGTVTPALVGYTDAATASANAVLGAFGYVTASHGSGSMTLMAGVSGVAENASGYTVDNAEGVRGIIGLSGAGNITVGKCVHAQGFDIGGGGIAELYGFYSDDLNSLATTAWAFYAAGDGWARFGPVALAVRGSDPAATNHAFIYAKDVTSSAEVFVNDEAGNVTQISPHDPDTGEWVFYSYNTKTGASLRVRMEALMEALTKRSGLKVEDYFFREAAK